MQRQGTAALFLPAQGPWMHKTLHLLMHVAMRTLRLGVRQV
jgi:hypothetical protein